MNHEQTEAIAVAAAAMVVEEGMEYAVAKRKAARDIGGRPQMPSNEQVEDAVRDHLAIFCADTQPAQLQALRRVALSWMERLQDFRPHLSGAVWRGTATQLSGIHLDLYCDDLKSAEIALINAGIRFDTGSLSRPGREPLTVLTVSEPGSKPGDAITLHLLLNDRDDQRGALKPDTRGRSWRGDIQALRRLLDKEDAP